MDTDFTRNYLILYLYNETWMADSVLIQHAIDTDPETELESLPEGARVHSVEKLHVPGLQEDRHLVIMSVINSFE